MATAGTPVSRASASAMKAAPDSCRTDTNWSAGCRSTWSIRLRNDSPGTV
jgi:hypothetical protein